MNPISFLTGGAGPTSVSSSQQDDTRLSTGVNTTIGGINKAPDQNSVMIVGIAAAAAVAVTLLVVSLKK